MSDHEPETAPRGLPAPLPEGERILWQGAPEPRALARQALHTRLVALYFAALAVFVLGMAWSEGRPLGRTAVSLVLIGAGCVVVLGMIRGYAVLIGRSAVYTITTHRVVMRVGVAFPVTINIPHAIVASAGLRIHADGTGDIPLTLSGTGRIGYVHLWPHARPWRLSRPEPMLRAVPDAGQAAAILARALGSLPADQTVAVRVDRDASPVRAPMPSAAA